jgi:hypothetical protein
MAGNYTDCINELTKLLNIMRVKYLSRNITAIIAAKESANDHYLLIIHGQRFFISFFLFK